MPGVVGDEHPGGAGVDAGAQQRHDGLAGDGVQRAGRLVGQHEPPLADESVTEIMVNGPSTVFAERKGKVSLTDVKFRDDAHALELANATQFGLAAGVWTSDLSRAHRMAQGIHAGRIWVNTYRVINDMVPGGGYGQSGYGAEGGTESLNALTRSKSVQIHLNPGLIPGQPRI